MTVLADKMHQMRGYSSAVHRCAYTISAYHWSWPRFFMDEDIGSILAPHWMDAHMYRDGMTVLADKMHTNVRLYISSTQVCLHYLCVSLVQATPLHG